MSIRRFAFSAVLAAVAVIAIPGATRAQTTKTQAPCPDALEAPDSLAGRPPCFLQEQRILSVKPYFSWSDLQGAKIELAPQLGVTAEDLESRLQEVLDAGALPACLLAVGRVHIGTTPTGDASSVTLLAKDPKDADRILSRARLLMK